MARVVSALILLPVVLGTVWFLPPIATLVLIEIALVIACMEYISLAARLGVAVPRAIVITAAMATCAAMALPDAPVGPVLTTAMIVAGAIAVAAGRPGAETLRDVSVTLFPLLYLALPFGVLAAIRAQAGREALLLLMVAIMVSDTAQYYSGRAFGRRLLAPALSPKKTIEGAIGGVLFGIATMAIVGRWWLPGAGLTLLLLLGAAIVLLGIAGDLFESMLKRSAGVKDTSALIPGHGGIMDRLDSWLFAAPVYFLAVRYLIS